MSAYIQFFIRHNDDFLPIGVFSRANVVYQVFNSIAPWEKLRPISTMHLNEAAKEVNELINRDKKALARLDEREKLVATFNNSVEEKLEALADYGEYKNEVVKELESEEGARAYIHMLYNVLDSIEYDKRFDMGAYLYVGIEVGDPTVEDLI